MVVKQSFTNEQIIHQLTTSWSDDYQGALTWYDDAGLNVADTLTYSFPQIAPTNVDGYAPSEASGLVQMTSAQLAAARLAFHLWDDLIDLRLVEAFQDSSADITFNYATDAATGGGTYTQMWVDAQNQITWYGSTGASAPTTNLQLSAAQVWIDSGWSSNQGSGLQTGGYALLTFEHEIGHALGLSHPGLYDASDGGDITFASSASYSRDNRQYTIMSYFGGYDGTWQQDGTWLDYYYPQTPMVDDILAIQAKYGRDYTTRSGDTVYGFNSSFGASDPERAIYDFSENAAPIFTIWDGGGRDTVDLSGYLGSQTVDLRPGSYSSIGGMVQNVAIAWGCTIESVICGSGPTDVLLNEFGNTILSGTGNDRFTAGAGADVFRFSGAFGSDTIFGFDAVGSSHDRIEFDRGVFADLASVLSHSRDDGAGGTLIARDASNVLHLAGVARASLDGGDFTFIGQAPASPPGSAALAVGTLSDGSGEVLWRNATSTEVGVWHMKSGSPSWTDLGGVSRDYQAVDTADYSGDGLGDILWLNGVTHEFGFWELKAGTVSSWTSLHFPGDSGWEVVSRFGNSDFTHDGSDDILWSNAMTREVGFWDMDHGASTGWHSFGQVAPGWRVQGTDDFMGDGSTDILWRNSLTQEVGFWDLKDGALAAWHSFGSVSPNWVIEATGDYRGDHAADILWRNSATGETGFWDIDDGAFGSWRSFGDPGSAWAVEKTGDYTGDGSADILWRNGVTGETGFWDLDDGAFSGWRSFGPVGADWLVS